MNHIIIGTAGHIDHGKTALVKALTGQDADRLPEEKERGITIDLGYAWCDLGTIRAGFIDVPGHEKLIANMVSGVTGMDMVLFTVAADEGMKPQSFEHLDIMDILGVRRGIVVITKADLADNDRIDIVREQIRQETAHTFLESAPVISTSIKTSEGIEELRQALQEMAEDIVHKRCKDTDQDGFVQEHGFPRLPVDRVFTLKGFGTVVTGTLISGYLNKDSKLAIYPRELPCKIRSIQSYGQDVAKAQAGQRCALNLPGIKTDQVSRGDVIALPGALHATLIMNVKLQVTKRFSRELENGMRAHLLIGTRRVLCRIYRFDDCYAQLRLEEPVCVLPGDRFILRFYSPVETIGGGIVIEADTRRARMSDKRALARIKHLEAVMKGLVQEPFADDVQKRKPKKEPAPAPIPDHLKKTADFLLKQFKESGFRFVSVNALDLTYQNTDRQKINQALKILERRGDIIRLDETHYTTAEIAERAQKTVVKHFHDHNELATACLRDLLDTNRTSARVLLEYLDRKKVTQKKGGAATHELAK